MTIRFSFIGAWRSDLRHAFFVGLWRALIRKHFYF
nr:MAG TPA_asm: hypothetical protein [Caudoviricetes sp.]